MAPSKIGPWVVFGVVSLLVAALWLITLWIGKGYFPESRPNLSLQVDPFAALGSLFSGVTIAGLVASILYQQRQLIEQLKENRRIKGDSDYDRIARQKQLLVAAYGHWFESAFQYAYIIRVRAAAMGVSSAHAPSQMDAITAFHSSETSRLVIMAHETDAGWRSRIEQCWKALSEAVGVDIETNPNSSIPVDISGLLHLLKRDLIARPDLQSVIH